MKINKIYLEEIVRQETYKYLEELNESLPRKILSLAALAAAAKLGGMYQQNRDKKSAEDMLDTAKGAYSRSIGATSTDAGTETSVGGAVNPTMPTVSKTTAPVKSVHKPSVAKSSLSKTSLSKPPEKEDNIDLDKSYREMRAAQLKREKEEQVQNRDVSIARIRSLDSFPQDALDKIFKSSFFTSIGQSFPTAMKVNGVMIKDKNPKVIFADILQKINQNTPENSDDKVKEANLLSAIRQFHQILIQNQYMFNPDGTPMTGKDGQKVQNTSVISVAKDFVKSMEDAGYSRKFK